MFEEMCLRECRVDKAFLIFLYIKQSTQGESAESSPPIKMCLDFNMWFAMYIIDI
jgi:hypothetical protein